MSSTDANENAYELALREFEHAAFIKPRPGSADQRLFGMAPLIVQEVSDEGSDTFSRFGRVVVGEDGELGIHEHRLTVYQRSEAVSLHDNAYEQLTYIWFYPGSGADGLRWRGVRMLLGGDGCPMVFEVLSDASRTAAMFVSQSFETAVAETHGDPQPGRRHAVESAQDSKPSAVVARVLEDGPQPMGPYVYLQDRELAVTTLLCRCMSAQVNDFVSSDNYYDILPFEDLPSPLIVRVSGELPGHLRDPIWLGRALRWPKSR
jgi:hypothetical protein